MNINLANTPANIIKGHGRNYTWCIFLKFDKDHRQAIYDWIREYLLFQLVSAEKQLEDCKKYKQDSFEGGMIVSFFLTTFGFKKLGIDETHQPGDFAFRSGMKSRGAKLNDTNPAEWEAPYQENIDAMILLADNSVEKLNDKENEIIQSLLKNEVGQLISTEVGKVLRKDGLSIEHFGYADGISQPPFFRLNGDINEDYLKMAFVQEPHYQNGSYMVYRKLEQNVKLFNQEINKIAKKLGNDPEFVGAQAIGRFKNGMPIVLGENGLANNFSYTEPNNDIDGFKCPFHAHTRKANPRDGGYENKRITRRGVTYGYRKADLSDQPETGVGLLFMCFQRSIVDQFEAIQMGCNNQKDHPRQLLINGNGIKKWPGIDPIIGQLSSDDRKVSQKWYKEWKRPPANGPLQYHLKKVVTLKGGAYFFAPPISLLQKIEDLANELRINGGKS